MECKVEENKLRCNCTYEPCSRKGICYDCIQYHWGIGEESGQLTVDGGRELTPLDRLRHLTGQAVGSWPLVIRYGAEVGGE